MLLFRSLTIGLLGACFLLLVQRPAQPAPQRRAVVPDDHLRVVDVAAGVTSDTLTALVQLGEDEHVVAVDDQRVAGDLVAGASIARHAAAGGYVDVTVSGHAGERRVLLLLH